MMTPKEKAKELIESFMNIKQQKLGDYSIIYYPTAKQCALIAVDKIIKETKLHDKTIYQHGRTAYWQEVKQEIEKL